MELKRAAIEDVGKIWKLQTESFADLLEKYQDYDISPGNMTMEEVKSKFLEPFSCFYFIVQGKTIVGGIRIVDRKDGSRKKISPMFIMKEFRNKGYAQAAIRKVEEIHGGDNWKLATILQEEGNCHLYEKMGYCRTGQAKIISDKMTIVGYEKN